MVEKELQVETPQQEEKPSIKKIGSILIIEDEQGIRELWERILQLKLNGEPKIIAAENGKEALQKLTDDFIRPDLIISDLRMKGMDGIETLRQLQILFREHNTDFNHVCLISGTMDQTPEEQDFLNNINATCRMKGGDPFGFIEEQIQLATEKLNQEPVTPISD